MSVYHSLGTAASITPVCCEAGGSERAEGEEDAALVQQRRSRVSPSVSWLPNPSADCQTRQLTAKPVSWLPNLSAASFWEMSVEYEPVYQLLSSQVGWVERAAGITTGFYTVYLEYISKLYWWVSFNIINLFKIHHLKSETNHNIKADNSRSFYWPTDKLLWLYTQLQVTSWERNVFSLLKAQGQIPVITAGALDTECLAQGHFSSWRSPWHGGLESTSSY